MWADNEGNNRVEEFTSEGVFVKMFGWGVADGVAKFETCTASCHAGLQGSGNGEFYVPEGIVLDSKGNIFVADRGNHRVQEFNSSLAWYEMRWQPEGKKARSISGSTRSGNIWVRVLLGQQDRQIGEFSNQGAFIQSWGTAGSTPAARRSLWRRRGSRRRYFGL